MFETEIVSSEEDAVLKADGTTFPTDATTTGFEDNQTKADVVYLHTDIPNAYTEHLKGGQA